MKKKLLCLLLACVSVLTLLLSGCGGTGGDPGSASKGVVNVYNWGEYIDMSVIDDFEAETGITVNYQMYESNEALYSKLVNDPSSYDVIIPSDYMIGQLIEEDLLEPLDFDQIPNFSDIDPTLKNPAYDPDNLYSVPYMVGILGIIYNTTLVDSGEDMETWEVLWNENYADNILMFKNSRDAIGIALKRLGYSYNTTNTDQIKEAVDLLIAQKPLVQAYVMDEIFDAMSGGNAAIGVYYYGDYLTMYESNEDLAFALPREGTNRYVDAMCIPKGAANQDNAQKFINFMCSTAAGKKNCEEVWYSTPLLSVREELDAEVVEDPFAYPDAEFLKEQCETFACLPKDIRQLYNDEWARLMNAS